MANGKPAEGSRHQVWNDLHVAWCARRRRLIGLLQAVETWMERSRQRRELDTLGDAVLKDLGLSRADIEAECRKPFWRP